MRPLLTIGILVYNKKPYLKTLLDQTIAQIAEGGLEREVEIVVSDNASTDGTQALMRGYMRRKLPYLRSNRNPRNLGFHGNILKEVELARGKYLWFMGDDELLPGGLARLLGIIKENDRNDPVFLMSIANSKERKVWRSTLFKSLGFILPNSANMSTTILPVAPAKQIRKDLLRKREVNKIWTHNQFSLLLGARPGSEYVLFTNDVFTYMTHFAKGTRPGAYGHLTNKEDYYDLLLYVDQHAGTDLFRRLPKAFEFLVFVPVVEAFNPEGEKVRAEIREMRKRYGLPLLFLTSLILLLPHWFRRLLADTGYLVYGQRYATFRRRLLS